MAEERNQERVGEAWQMHRNGNNAGAIEIFEDVIRSYPEDLDALYGLGLARRSNGNDTGATDAFSKALTITKERLAELDGGKDVTQNLLDSEEDDRLLMLRRMISQRLEEIEARS
ncbi:MAG: tetratricopeptide repeat protein [Chloroflexota bacterium]